MGYYRKKWLEKECSLAPFVSASTSQKIPFVFLPLRGQIVHPSREIRFEGIQTAICAVAGAQYLSRTGWNEVRNPLDMDVPFRLFRDDGRTYLQWLGESDLRSRLEGRLVLVNLMCRDTAPRKDNAPTPTTGEIFTPCVAFRVVGTPAKHITNVSEVVFAPDARSTEAAVSGAGLGMDEYIAIGISSVLLGSIYVASVFLYLHLKRRRQKKEEEIEQQHQQQIQQVQPLSHHLDKSVIKNNPLLGLSTRHFPVISDSGSYRSDTSQAPSEHESDFGRLPLVCSSGLGSIGRNSKQQIGAIVHPQARPPPPPPPGTASPTKIQQNLQQQSPHVNPAQDLKQIHKACIQQIQQQQHMQQLQQDAEDCLPEENVSIVEEPEEKVDPVKAIVNGTARRKLYFNPAYFEPQMLRAPPPAAVEFLTKIREVITIAKHKMNARRYVPSLGLIAEEEATAGTIGLSLKRENSRRRGDCSGCPGCEPRRLNLPPHSCHDSGKQQSIQKWLETVDNLTSEEEDQSAALAKSLRALTDTGKALGRGANLLTGRSHSPFNRIVKSPLSRIRNPDHSSPRGTLTRKKPLSETASDSTSCNTLPRKVDYDADSLERGASRRTPVEYGDCSSQSSPSLRQALPMEEEMTIRNETIDSEYSLVSEVYVNDTYDNGSTKRAKIEYKEPGHLLIEVEHCPPLRKISDTDGFEPDTLDRKPTKKITPPKSGQILLRTTGSFKSDSLTRASVIADCINKSQLSRNFGSLREIYEARSSTRVYTRPCLSAVDFKGSTRSLDCYAEGRILTLEERHSRRQRRSEQPTLPAKPKAPDVIPSQDQESPIYQRPKPPRRVEESDSKHKSVLRNFLLQSNTKPSLGGQDKLVYRTETTDSRGKTWKKLIEMSNNKTRTNKPEDSGYLSTDSNDSAKKTTIGVCPSETDESVCDGQSESGAESVETHSVFFGNFRKKKQQQSDSDSDGGKSSLVTVKNPGSLRSNQSTISGGSRRRSKESLVH
ncbi:uncharacterized protein LOC113384391 [Ctenocephalides felis]|uniref:uncharacterized protein LOC113384391 n=1 Tax=Ctenocephalides felis TaxID=7515 RepID=UPI000E6E5492|nr:uncharacterized protein LOC113384391 [Ctenocephalides felis]